MNQSRIIGLVGCCKTKQKTPGQYRAEDLYISPLFTKTITYLKQRCDEVYILSAKYGVLSLDEMIEDYDETLRDMDIVQAGAWGRLVTTQFKLYGINLKSNFFNIATGSAYYAPILSHFDDDNFCLPLGNLPIGKRMQFLDKEIAAFKLDPKNIVD